MKPNYDHRFKFKETKIVFIVVCKQCIAYLLPIHMYYNIPVQVHIIMTYLPIQRQIIYNNSIINYNMTLYQYPLPLIIYIIYILCTSIKCIIFLNKCINHIIIQALYTYSYYFCSQQQPVGLSTIVLTSVISFKFMLLSVIYCYINKKKLHLFQDNQRYFYLYSTFYFLTIYSLTSIFFL